VPVGFSGGGAFAGGLVLADPGRYAGAGILYATLPFDAGVPTTPGRLAGMAVLVAHGDADHVIPADLLERTWTYLNGDAGSGTTAVRDPGGHGLSAGVVDALSEWIGRLLPPGDVSASPAGRPGASRSGS
jgi:phospholipase/carboxylesterase